MKLATLVSRFNGRCIYCGKLVNCSERSPHPDAPTRDHFIPLSKGGSRSARNTVLACVDCNQAKADTDPLTLMLVWIITDPKGFKASLRAIVLDLMRPEPPLH